MTDKLDAAIEEALDAEEHELLRAIGEEPGYFRQVFNLFGGSLGWISWLLMIAQTLMFIVSVWMAVRFFGATDALEALRWGIPSATLLVLSAQMKFLMWPSLQANRVIRELKRVELQLARKD